MWTLGLLVSTCAYLRQGAATCEHLGYLCLPLFTWGIWELHVGSGTTCVYLSLLEGRHSYMWTLGPLVSTCVYLRDRRATCGLWFYLCLPVFTWGKAQLHVNTWATCVYLCLLEGRHSYMWTLGLLVSTCAYLWDRKLSCGYFDALWNDQLELHECFCSPKCFDYLGMPSNLWEM